MATIILKATEKCNSNCYYCDVVRKQNTGNSMSLCTLETFFRRVDDYLKANESETFDILWHGGEPLLLGPDYFRSALKLQNTHCGDTKNRIRYSIQTNLTLLSEHFIDIFHEFGIKSVGTSFDPEPHMRGPGTPSNSDKYNELFFRALQILERHGIGWGIIYVVTKKALRKPLDVFYYLTNLKLTGGININPVLVYDEQRQDIAITPDEYVEFLGTILPYWLKHRNRYPDVEPFRSLAGNILDGNLSVPCVYSGNCTYNHINVAPDGETSQCGRSSDWGILNYGNIRERSFADILQDPQREQLVERVQLLRTTDCRDCRFWDICHGGCPLDAYSKHKSYLHKSEWCHARKGFIEKYFEPLTGAKFQSGNRHDGH